MVQNIFGNRRAKLGHAFCEPQRHTSAMQRQVRKSRSLHQNYFSTKNESPIKLGQRLKFVGPRLRAGTRKDELAPSMFGCEELVVGVFPGECRGDFPATGFLSRRVR